MSSLNPLTAMLGFVVLGAVLVAVVKVWEAVQRRRRGKALDVFQKRDRPMADLVDQLTKVKILQHGEFRLSYSLDLVGFGPTARAFGSVLNQKVVNAKNAGRGREEILVSAIDEIVSVFNGSFRKSLAFYGIASQRHRLNWTGPSRHPIPLEVSSTIEASAEQYRADKKAVAKRRRDDKAVLRAKKILGTDK